MSAPKEMPAKYYVNRMELLGLVARDDGPAAAYLRWHMPGVGVGVAYASHLPYQWGVYWVAGADVRAAWVKTFDDALTLLNAMSRVM